MIQFNVLGEIRLHGADGHSVDSLLRQPKRLALLAYLACPAPGTWHRRDTLLALFWPELDTAHARTSLRNAVYVLRQALGDAVIRSRGNEEISVDPETLRTDLGDLLAALGEDRHADGLALYRGELLPGLFPPDSEGFQRWLDAERARLTMVVARAGVEWVNQLESAGQLAEAATAARRVLDIHPDDETTVRRLMNIHATRGDRAGALVVYEEYRARLAREFEAEPAVETVALAERLRAPSHSVPRPSTPPQHVTIPGPRTDPPAELAAAPPPPLPAEAPPREPDRPGLRNRVVAGVLLALAGAVGWAVWPTPTLPTIGKSTPVTADEGLQIEPAIAPNGRLVAYAQGSSHRMRILVQNLAGGPRWPLTGDTNAVEIMPRWSPDGDQLVYLARNGAWVAPAIGGAPRLIAPGGVDEAMVRSAAWSPGGDSVVIVRNDSVLVRPLEGAGARLVGTGSQLHSCVWSPNGRWIACVSGNWIAFVPGTTFGNRAPSSLVRFPAVGGTAEPLTDADHSHTSPAWSADSRYLWLLSDRDGPIGGVYALRIGRDGGAVGTPQRVGLEAESISLSGGRIAYSVYSRRANIWTIPIPNDGPVGIGAATPVTTGNQIIEVVQASPDGRWLVYDSNLRGQSDLYRVPIGGGPVERLTDDPRPEFVGVLSPDGRELAYHMWVGGERRLMVKDLERGLAAEIVPTPGDQGTPRWSPTGNRIAAWDHSWEPGAIFVVHRNQAGRWAPPAWRLGEAQLPAWSPDGRTLALLTPAGTVELMPADSGQRRRLYAPVAGTEDPLATFLAWDAGRDEIWFLGHTPAGQGGIWGLPLAGGRPRLVVNFQNTLARTNGLGIASDGKRFYFTLEERISNVWWAELVPH